VTDAGEVGAAGADVVVAGAGPAGRVLARECALRGLRTVLVAPRPDARWPATYGLWLDEAELLPPGAGYVVARARVLAGGERWLERAYAVLDNDSVRNALTHPDVVVRAGRVEEVTAPVIVDATGARSRGGVEQTAYGLRVPAPVAARVVRPGEVVFMDWRQPGTGPPTFLYAVPLPDGRVLLEETSLARRPGLPFAVLRERLLARLAEHGVDPGRTEAEVERVRIPLDAGASAGAGRVVRFGAAAGLVHPASGYGVADALRLAPAVAGAIATGGAAAARRVVWPARARAVHRLRRAGLRTLLTLDPDQTAEFFGLFFALPPHRQRAYLSGRDDLAGTAAAMAALFGAARWPLRRRMALRR
jgi:lycopene beta-cyclase